MPSNQIGSLSAVPRHESYLPVRRSGWRSFQFAVKRVGDFVISLLLLILLLPLFGLVAVAIRIDSRGAPILRQERWGRGQSRIGVYKFRTMYVDLSDRAGVVQTVANDPRITRIGAFLRKTSIDELPQLLNVLKGEMSLVGPRPHPIGMLAAGMLYEHLVPSYFQRLEVLPGITGWAQVHGLRGPTVDADMSRRRIEYDLAYIHAFSLSFDVAILLRTVVQEFRGGTGS